MVNVKINGVDVVANENATILDIAKKIGVEIPTLCYLKDINEIGACKMCVVEVVGSDRLVSACNTKVYDGMEILTDSEKVKLARKVNLELILSEHNFDCENCVRNENCPLQKLAVEYNIDENKYGRKIKKCEWDNEFPLIRDESKCIKCMRCVSVCEKIQHLGIWDTKNVGVNTTVSVKGGKQISFSDCSICGQCITHCPTGALKERDDTDKVLSAIENKDKITVFQIAPSVRTSWGEPFGVDREFATVKRLVSALKEIGADYVFDTDFAADLTIMEEGNEFLTRLPEIKKSGLPMFTSCCPAWVRFIKARYPEFIERLSTAKSPQQMFGAIAKTYYAKILGVTPNKIYSVSIMPCVSKKDESALFTMRSAESGQDVDAVLTTREIIRLLKKKKVDVKSLDEKEFDAPLGFSSGAGVIFGTTGGVMEAALRSAYYIVTGNNPKPEAFSLVRGDKNLTEATFNMGETEVKVAVVSGLNNAAKLLEDIKAKKVKYDFVEVMACPNGCIGGGGQPYYFDKELVEERKQNIYSLDKKSNIRFSHENPSVLECYKNFLGSPLSETSEKLLHTNHNAWQMPKED